MLKDPLRPFVSDPIPFVHKPELQLISPARIQCQGNRGWLVQAEGAMRPRRPLGMHQTISRYVIEDDGALEEWLPRAESAPPLNVGERRVLVRANIDLLSPHFT